MSAPHRSEATEGPRAEPVSGLVAAVAATPPSATEAKPGSAGERSRTPIQVADRAAMLVYRAELTMAVNDVATNARALEALAKDTGGYLVSRTNDAITIRVPREKFDESLKRAEQLGDVTNRAVTTEDVSDRVRDLEVRIKNARAMRDRLETLLQRAAVKEALEIEKELGRITEEVERLGGELESMRVQIAYSTITVKFQPMASAVSSRLPKLPFPWLKELGLGHLLALESGRGR